VASNKLTIISALPGTAGNYSVVITNYAGAITSSPPVQLTLLAAPPVKPTLFITSPTSGQTFATNNPVITVSGTIRSNQSVTAVYYRLNDGEWATATSANAYANWTGSGTMTNGANTVSAYAVYAGTDFSATNKVAFKYIASGELVVQINGDGTISPAKDTNTFLTLGVTDTITAVPAKNWIFFSWTTADGALLSTDASYKFTLNSASTNLRANFVTNLFLAAQGTYNGLFAPAIGPRQQTTSGSFTLKVTSSGSLSGDLYLGSATPISVSGKFGPDGTAIITEKHGATTLTNTLMLDTTNQTVSGTIGDGSFDALLMGSQAVNTAAYAGHYTVVIPGTDSSMIGPFGTTYGTVTVTSSGAISFAGSLADGTAVSQSSAVSKDGVWPFYLPLYNGKGSIYSWNNFTNNITNGTIVLATNASWINATNSTAGAVYKAGFTNDATVIYASAYTTNLLMLPDGMGQVVLDGGGLSTSITNSITLASNDKITVTTNADKMALTINKTTGVISGTFTNGSKTISVNGVLFQSATNAQGYFLGTNQTSGTFLLSP
jgi:hypothetical protein